MKHLLRACLIAVALMLTVMPSVSAATLDGLDISITTNQEEYDPHESIVVEHTIVNTNDTPVTNIVLENTIPEGYEAQKGKEYTKKVDSLAPGESFQFSSTLKSTTPNNSSVLTIILLCAGGLVLLGGGTSITLVLLHNKKKKQAMQLLSLVLCVALVGGMTMPVMAGSDPTTLNLTHEVLVDDQPLLLSSRLTYDPIYGEKANLIIDTADMVYDEGTQTYHLLAPMPQLTGTLLYTEGVKSATCFITDDNNKTLFSGTFTPQNMWAVKNIGLIVGINHVRVAVAYEDDMTYECTFKVNNVCEENMNTLDVDKGDNDQDGVLNFIEELKHTDLNNPDTDADRLTDYDEIATLGTDPLKQDTDQNGVQDGDEDADGDGLSNYDEIHTYNSNPVGVDTDADHLTDAEELNTYHTDPTEKDTDEDGRTDGWEVENDYDPLIPNTDFPEEEIPSPDYVEAESDGEVFITELDNDYFVNEDTPGYIGVNPIDVELEEGHSANISIEYDPSKTEGETPTLYRFNQQTQRYEEIDSTADGNKVSATITEGGVYVLLNHRHVEDVWHNNIFRPSETDADGTIDMVFAIDFSGSMDTNDPNDIRLLVTKEFIAKLRDTDRAALVQYESDAEVAANLTSDKELLYNTLDSMSGVPSSGCGGGGTDGATGIRAALDELEGSPARYKYIIFLTDGEDNEYSEPYFSDDGPSLTSEAIAENIIIHTVGLVGSAGVDVQLLKDIAEATGGEYFLATVGEEPENNPELIEIYDQIEGITIDRVFDTNDDGISDYYTRLICEGKLGTHTGTQNLFDGVSYEEIQKNADYDGDGIRNGDELVIEETTTGVFVKVVSLPCRVDSDGDGLSDKDETDHTTSPMRRNSHVESGDITFLLNNANFKSHEYLTKYNDSLLTQGAVFVGNIFFGTTLDQTVLYRQALLNYFEIIDKTLMTSQSEATLDAYADAFYDAVKEALTEETIRLAATDNVDAFLEWVGKVEDFYSDFTDVVEKIDQTVDLTTQYKTVSDALFALVNMKDSFEKAACEKAIATIAECMKDIAYRMTDISPQIRNNWLNVLQEPYTRLIERASGLKKTLKIRTDVFKKLKKVGKVVGKVFDAIEISLDVANAYKDYKDTVDALETIESNMYILDCITSSSGNFYLLCAASDIRAYLNEHGSNFMIALDRAEGVVTKYVLEYAHTCIAKAGVPGLIIEAIRVVGNVFFNLDEKAEGAAKTVALAATAEILAENFSDHLDAGYATKIGTLWVAFNSYSEEIYVCTINLAALRSEAEANYMKWKKKVTANCESNIEKCNTLVSKYNNKYFLYLQT